MANLKNMKYGNFTWPNNPSECNIDCEKISAKHKYPDYNYVDVEDFGMDASILTGTGEFFGKDAYKNWRALLAEFAKNGVRTVYHPIYSNLKYGLMTKCSAALEPRPNYVKYTFEMIASYTLNSNSKAIVLSEGISGPSGSGVSTYGATVTEDITSKFTIGDLVTINGDVYYTSNGRFKNTVSNLRSTITNIVDGAEYPIHYGSDAFGWVKSSSVTMRFGGSNNTGSSNSNVIRHIVKVGETIQSICAKYGIYDWQAVASANKIKNTKNIHVGQELLITIDR